MVPVSMVGGGRRHQIDWSKEPDDVYKPVELLSEKGLDRLAESQARFRSMYAFANLALIAAVTAGWVSIPPENEKQTILAQEAISTPPLTAHTVAEDINFRASRQAQARFGPAFGADPRWALGDRAVYAQMPTTVEAAQPGSALTSERMAMAKSDAKGEASLVVQPQTAQEPYRFYAGGKGFHPPAVAAKNAAPAIARWVVAGDSQPVNIERLPGGAWRIRAKSEPDKPVTLWAYAADEEKGPQGQSRFVGHVGATLVSDSREQLSALKNERSRANQEGFAVTLSCFGAFFALSWAFLVAQAGPWRYEKEQKRREGQAWRGKVAKTVAPARGPRMR